MQSNMPQHICTGKFSFRAEFGLEIPGIVLCKAKKTSGARKFILTVK